MLGVASYQNGLAGALSRAGFGCRVIRCGVLIDVTDYSDRGSPVTRRRFHGLEFSRRALWASWRRLPLTGRSCYPQVITSRMIGRAVAPHADAEGVFHGLTTFSLETLRRKRSRMVSIIENNVRHAESWQHVVEQECRTFGVTYRQCDAVLPKALIRRMISEYNLCDAVIVPSSTAKASFAEFGLADKTIIVWAGVDELQFTPAAAPPEKFRAIFVGRLELGKGIPYLIDAWRRLDLKNAELLLVGEVRPEIRRVLKHNAHSSIRVVGFVPPDQVVEHMRRSTVMVMPSVNEGLARTMLEAMSCGIPVVATEMSGAQDCVQQGVTGFIVPSRDVNALANAIDWCYRHPAQLTAMGAAGRQAVLRRFTIKHYEERQIRVYRALLSGTLPHSVDVCEPDCNDVCSAAGR